MCRSTDASRAGNSALSCRRYCSLHAEEGHDFPQCWVSHLRLSRLPFPLLVRLLPEAATFAICVGLAWRFSF